jgi:hypothetical protein
MNSDVPSRLFEDESGYLGTPRTIMAKRFVGQE